MKHKNREYQLCKNLAIYMRLQHRGVPYHFDMAGLNLSKVQAGMMKGIQGMSKFPDLFIAEPRGMYHGMFLEIKHEDAYVFKKDGTVIADDHLQGQASTMALLNLKGYYSSFGIGFDDCKNKIDKYLKL